MDLARVAIAIDTTPAQEGLRGLSQRFAEVKGTATSAHQVLGQGSVLVQKLATTYTELGRTSSAAMKQLTQAQQVAVAQTDAFANRLKAQQAAFKEQQLRGAITPAQAQQLGEAAAAAYNRGVLRVLDRGNAQGAFSGRQGLAVYTQIATTLKDAGTQAESAASGFGRLQGPLQSLLINLSGLPGPLGKVAVGLSSIAVGSVLTIGIAAAGAAIAALIGNIIERHQRQREEVDKLIGKYADLKNVVRDADEKTLRSEILAEQKRIASLSRGRTAIISDASGDVTSVGGVDVKSLEESIRRKSQLERELAGIKKAAADDALDAQSKEIAGVRTLIDLGKATTADLAKRTALVASLTAERQKEGVTFERRVQIETELNQLANAGKKNADESAKAADQRLKLAEAELDLLKALGELTGNRAAVDAVNRAKALADIESQVAALDKVSAADKERLRTILQQAEAARELLKVLETQAKVVGPAFDVNKLGIKPAQISGGAGSGFADDLDQALERYRIASGQATEAADAQADAEQSLADKHRQNAQLALQAADALISLGAQLGFLSPKAARLASGLVDLGAAILNARPGDILKAGVGLIGGLLGDGGRAKRDEGRRQRKDQLDSIDSFIESLRPQGTQLEELTRSYEELLKKGREVGLGNHELARLTDAYTAAQKRLVDQIQKAQGLFARELEARAAEADGQAERAAAIRRQLADEAELRDAQAQGFDAATLARLEEVQALERQADALKRARDAAEEAAKAQQELADKAQRNSEFGGALGVRRLAAIGATKESEDYRRALEQEAEIRAALTAGISDANLEMLKFVQTLENQAVAAARAAEETRAVADLEVRRLQATGQTDAADQRRFELEQERERLDAITGGKSAAFLAQLVEVQKLEAAARIQKNLDGAFGVSNPDFTGSRNTVAEARTITATEANSGLAMMRTMTFFLERIEYNTRSSGGGAGNTGTITFTPNDNDLGAGVTRQARTLGTRPAL